ncbi:MAG: RNA methyltransferase [Chitinophagaceae bacterium]|nr:RNA methyltransferase [Chitinophagaceae bacterium]
MISKSHTKYIQSLQHKKLRDQLNLFIAEGPKVVPDLLSGGNFVCKEIIALKEWLDANAGLVSANAWIPFTEVQDFELEKISALLTPHAVLAVFEKREPETDVDISKKITIVLDTIQDPGNMGTIIRIADWFGIQNIICSAGCADIYNPKVVQATMGSLGRVNVVYTDLAAWLTGKKKVPLYAASLKGRPLQSLGKLTEGIIIIGNEAHGIRDEVMQLVKEKITIPRIGEAESLNAAVATGIILSHVV